MCIVLIHSVWTDSYPVTVTIFSWQSITSCMEGHAQWVFEPSGETLVDVFAYASGQLFAEFLQDVRKRACVDGQKVRFELPLLFQIGVEAVPNVKLHV